MQHARNSTSRLGQLGFDVRFLSRRQYQGRLNSINQLLSKVLILENVLNLVPALS